MPPASSIRHRSLVIPRRRRRGGFALLITITLLAFLVLLLVSLASLTRVETQVAANNQQLARARQNALLGLNVALGRLQALAGPDQRVTGPADLVKNRQDSKQHWTGVWDGAYAIDPADASFQHARGWLVSGTAPAGPGGVTSALAAASGNTLVELVGSHTTDTTDPGAASNAVSVETEPIKAGDVPGLPGGATVGNFAYWVGDEGVKASVTLVDPYADPADTQHRYSLVAAQRNALERMETAVSATPATPSLLGSAYPANDDARLSKVITPAQLPFVQDDATASALLATTARTRFHDLTTWSASLPVDVARGGLKRDLTAWLRSAPAGAAETDTALIYDPSALAGDPNAGGDTYGLPRWGIVRTYAGITDDGATHSASPALSTTTQAQNGLFPVITYYRLGFNISCAGDDQPLVIHIFPLVVLWNPYNIPIAATRYEADFGFNNGGEGFIWKVGSAAGATLATLDLTKSTAGALTYWRFQIDQSTEIPPGASLVFTPGSTAAYDPDHGGNVLVNAVDGGDSATIDTGATLSAADRAQGVYWDMNAAWVGGQYNLVLRALDAASPGALKPADFAAALPGALQASRRIGYGVPAAFTLSPFPTLPPVASEVQFIAYARMASTSNWKSRWIAAQNLRGPLALSVRDYEDVNTPLYAGGSARNVTPSFDGKYASAGLRVDSGARTDFVLADFQPAGLPLFSLAQLQHANLSQVHANPSYAVGNSMADPIIPLDKTSVANSEAPIRTFYDLSWLLNRELWDRYFFSTVPASLTAAQLADPAFHLPNARLVFNRDEAAPPLDEVGGATAFRRAAAHLLVNGGFNVNSTSWQAWRTLLSCHVGLVTDGANRHLFDRAGALAGSPNGLWNGYRVLSDAQVDRLAWNIVQEVRTRGPFLSLADFVNRRLLSDASNVAAYKGALQAAIDTTDTETTAASGPPRAPINTDATLTATANLCDALSPPAPGAKVKYDPQRFQGGPDRQAPYSSRVAFAPGDLTQADLLTALGPALTARSDTFVIRAYGDARNPVTTAVEGKAWCEAVVQRTPGYVEDAATAPWDTPAAGSVNETFGRRFKIVAFRWLSASDL